MKKIKKTVLGFLFAMLFVSPSFGGTTNVGFAVDLTSMTSNPLDVPINNSRSPSLSISLTAGAASMDKPV